MTLFTTKIFAIVASAEVLLAALWAVIGCIQTATICHPVSYFWDRDIIGGYCKDPTTLQIIFGAGDVIGNAFILFLPICVLSRLRLGRRRKTAVMGVFLLGGL
jgi:hypothetical protein